MADTDMRTDPLSSVAASVHTEAFEGLRLAPFAKLQQMPEGTPTEECGVDMKS